jgi:two-component system OmpR family response regulator
MAAMILGGALSSGPQHEEPAMPTILVVDDDAHLREVLQYALEKEGFKVETAKDGAEGLARAEREEIDLVVLDILMPELDGLEVCRRLRAKRSVPIIFLSSKGEDEVDRIVGLELGGDDYLPKPFSPRELCARVRAVLRRGRPAETPAEQAESERMVVGPIVLEPAYHRVTCNEQPVQLTVTEFNVLRILLRRPGQVLTRTGLVNEVYSLDHYITERTIDTHVRRIRAKFRPTGHDPIETVHGLGYKARVP